MNVRFGLKHKKRQQIDKLIKNHFHLQKQKFSIIEYEALFDFHLNI